MDGIIVSYQNVLFHVILLRQCFSEKWRNVGECWHFSFFIFSRILVHLAYWRIIFFSQSTCKSPKKSVLKIDPPLYSISFCSFSRDYLWTSFEPNRSTGKDNLQRVINEIVWKFAHIIRRGISMEWRRGFCLKCFYIQSNFDWICYDRNRGCVYVCACVRTCVCLCQRYSLNGSTDFNDIFHKGSLG